MSDPINEKDVRHVAKLSRLKLTDEQIAHYTQQLGAVLGYMDKLGELDLDDVEPLAHPTEITNALRPDETSDPIDTDAALANAPASDPPYFKVPKVLGDGGGA